MKNSTQMRSAAFTLIELSLVLVIIGLIAGGILVGQDLIKAAEIRAQISQIDKIKTSIRTFQLKYGYLPGDIPNNYATQFGFLARGGGFADGDGNGMIDGCAITHRFGCETSLFWSDLRKAVLIDGDSSTLTDGYNVITTNIINQLPVGKINNNYLAVFCGEGGSYKDEEVNYLYLGGIVSTDTLHDYVASSSISPLQAKAMDSKMDDGQPQSGAVSTVFAGGGMQYDTSYSINNCAISTTEYNIASSNNNSLLYQLAFKF